jgi:hypothetical protein
MHFQIPVPMLPAKGLVLSKNRVHKGELALVFCDYWQTWSRLLYAYEGTYVEVDLTPVVPQRALSWEKVKGVNIRRHYTKQGAKDKRYTCVMNGSIVHRMVYDLMKDHLEDTKIAELLYRDFLPEIDWTLHRDFNHKGNGVFFKDCMKRQPS